MPKRILKDKNATNEIEIKGMPQDDINLNSLTRYQHIAQENLFMRRN